MLTRYLQPFIEDRLRHMPGVVLLGPRQVGKTTLASSIVAQRKGTAVYLDLERPADRRRLTDADAYLRSQSGKLVVIDEIHRAARQVLKPKESYLVHGGDQTWPIGKGVEAISLGDLMRRLALEKK